MILAPTSTGAQEIDGRIFWTPSDFFALFEEFEVLDNLRKYEGEEGFLDFHHSWFPREKLSDHDRKENVFRE